MYVDLISGTCCILFCNLVIVKVHNFIRLITRGGGMSGSIFTDAAEGTIFNQLFQVDIYLCNVAYCINVLLINFLQRFLEPYGHRYLASNFSHGLDQLVWVCMFLAEFDDINPFVCL